MPYEPSKVFFISKIIFLRAHTIDLMPFLIQGRYFKLVSICLFDIWVVGLCVCCSFFPPFFFGGGFLFSSVGLTANAKMSLVNMRFFFSPNLLASWPYPWLVEDQNRRTECLMLWHLINVVLLIPVAAVSKSQQGSNSHWSLHLLLNHSLLKTGQYFFIFFFPSADVL